MANKILKKMIIEAVENQLENNNPICTKITYEKLVSAGTSSTKAKEMIGAILIEEIYDVMKNKEYFNEKRYCEKLSKLI